AFFVDERLVSVTSLARPVAITQPSRAGAIANILDVPKVFVQESEVFLVALSDTLEVPEPREGGESLAQPGVPIRRGTYPVTPPLVGDLVCAEKLVEAIERGVLKRHP